MVLLKSVFARTLVELESWRTKPSVGSLALTNSFGTTYLSLYIFSSKLLSSSFLRTYVILSVVNEPLLACIVLPVALVWTNHWPTLVSYWIGCPASFGFLSETLLIILNLSVVLATVATNTGTAKSAFVFDDAIRIWFAPNAESCELVIAK